MNNRLQIGRLFYSLGIIAYGTQQIIIWDFRPEIVPPSPAWAHKYAALSIITGLGFIIMGIISSGLFKIKERNRKHIYLYLGFLFLLLILIFQLPYVLIISPNKIYHLGVWAQMLKELAFSGGGFVMAGSFVGINAEDENHNFFVTIPKLLIPFGRIFFSTTMILFGYSHFLYTQYVSLMVPKMFGMPVFWTYFGGVALMGAGICIILKIFIKPVAFLLAIMLFLWFILLHIPHAIADPYSGNGNKVVSAFDALLFCGVSLVIALRANVKKISVKEEYKPSTYFFKK